MLAALCCAAGAGGCGSTPRCSPRCAVTALLVASALSLFDYRYELAAVILLPPAAALAVVAFRPRCRNRASRTASPPR